MIYTPHSELPDTPSSVQQHYHAVLQRIVHVVGEFEKQAIPEYTPVVIATFPNMRTNTHDNQVDSLLIRSLKLAGHVSVDSVQPEAESVVEETTVTFPLPAGLANIIRHARVDSAHHAVDYQANYIQEQYRLPVQPSEIVDLRKLLGDL